MKVISDTMEIEELKTMAEHGFGDLVKAVVDVKKGVMAIDAEMHADQESFLLEQGSVQENLWGINIYPYNALEEMIEFDSMINLRPWQENRSRGVENPDIREKIVKIVNQFIV